ncbi:unnamed protein product [Parnassius apollo]|uniref:(apollo) hypothetical protein n=1 Tax=Parnassius apollo TaxID=110799 RepID=A0A8S3WMH6_PARAO|nr:unnamed protein product [Parnassius apollo]
MKRDAASERYEISLTRDSTRRRANSAREPTNNSHASSTNNAFTRPRCPPRPSGRKLSYLSPLPPLVPERLPRGQEIPARIFTAS